MTSNKLSPRQTLVLVLAGVRPMLTLPEDVRDCLHLTAHGVGRALRYGPKVLEGSLRYLVSRLPGLVALFDGLDGPVPEVGAADGDNTILDTLALFHAKSEAFPDRRAWVAHRREVALARLWRWVDRMETWEDAIDLTVCMHFASTERALAERVAAAFCDRIARPSGPACRPGVLQALLPHLATDARVDLRAFVGTDDSAYEPTDRLFLRLLSLCLHEPRGADVAILEALTEIRRAHPARVPLAASQLLLRLGALPDAGVRRAVRHALTRGAEERAAWLRVSRFDLEASIECAAQYDYGTPMAEVLRGKLADDDRARGPARGELDLLPLLRAALHSIWGLGGRTPHGEWSRDDVSLVAALPVQWAICHCACEALAPAFRDDGAATPGPEVERFDGLARIAAAAPVDARVVSLFAEWFERRWTPPPS